MMEEKRLAGKLHLKLKLQLPHDLKEMPIAIPVIHSRSRIFNDSPPAIDHDTINLDGF